MDPKDQSDLEIQSILVLLLLLCHLIDLALPLIQLAQMDLLDQLDQLALLIQMDHYRQNHRDHQGVPFAQWVLSDLALLWYLWLLGDQFDLKVHWVLLDLLVLWVQCLPGLLDYQFALEFQRALFLRLGLLGLILLFVLSIHLGQYFLFVLVNQQFLAAQFHQLCPFLP